MTNLKNFRSSCLLGSLVVLLSLSGCATKPFDPGVAGPFHRIGNYFLVNDRLPDSIRRVVMLPLSASQNDSASKEGRATLQPILYSEVSKSRLFEVEQITEEQMRQWTGKPTWSASEELPADFLNKIREKTACDAILFSQLTYFRPYPPIAIGWRLLMVKADDGQAIWSVDEVFDAGEPRVVNSARRYAIQNEQSQAEFMKEAKSKHGAAWSVWVPGMDWINSPRHFAKYTASAAVDTLRPK